MTQPVLLTRGIDLDDHAAGLRADFFGTAADEAAAGLPHVERRTLDHAGHRPPADPRTVLNEFFNG